MKLQSHRRNIPELEIFYTPVKTPLGLILMAATDLGLCDMQFGSSLQALILQLKQEYPQASLTLVTKENQQRFELWTEALNDYLAGNSPQLDLPLDIKGSAFEMKVWKYLQSIPRAGVQSYTQVAQGIGAPKAFRAVAKACASNKIAIAIPCHRVIRGNGALAGYRWGLERKQTLLDLEKIPVSSN